MQKLYLSSMEASIYTFCLKSELTNIVTIKCSSSLFKNNYFCSMGNIEATTMVR